MVYAAGVDIGSTASKAVVIGPEGKALGQVVGASSTNPAKTAREIYAQALAEAGLAESDVAYVVGTGYGRTLVPFATKNVSEITCHGRGAHHLDTSVRTVIDIGGQDTKIIAVDADGALLDFAMNDKCAAGTGRFLEAMARSMQVGFGQMDDAFGRAEDARRITSMCSVFAESEVINLINDGVPLPPIVRGLFQSLANRVASLARRAGIIEEVAMTGGVAKSGGVRRALEEKLKIKLVDFGSDPQLVGALGAALVARDFALSEAAGG